MKKVKLLWKVTFIMIFYIDCSDIIHDAKNTGIQRVARNLINKRGQTKQALGIIIQPVFYNRFYGFIKVNGCKPSDIKDSVDYPHSILMCLSRFWQLKRFILTALPVPRMQYFINRHWNNRFCWLITRPLCLAILPVICIFSLFYTLFIPPRNKWKPQHNDVFIVPGSTWWNFHYKGAITNAKRHGCQLAIVIFDLIPILHPKYCGNYVHSFSSNFPLILAKSNLIIAISETTKNDINSYITNYNISPYPVTKSFRLGADLDLIVPTDFPRASLQHFFQKSQSTYLCVSTIEPRKNHDFLLDAFETIWKQNPDIQLCIAGKYGWKSKSILTRIRSHRLYNKTLLWYEDLDDAELAYCYKNAKALIFPSIVEGFGLPIVEAFLYNCPVLASDIPAFREIGGNNCIYFSIISPDHLACTVLDFDRNDTPKDIANNAEFDWISWEQSADELYSIIKDHFDDSSPPPPEQQGT